MGSPGKVTGMLQLLEYVLNLPMCLILNIPMRTKWSDCYKVDNKYTIAMSSVWRYFKIGKYKNQEVKRICYLYPSYIEWYLQGWKRKLSQDPNNEELALKVKRQELLYSLRR